MLLSTICTDSESSRVLTYHSYQNKTWAARHREIMSGPVARVLASATIRLKTDSVWLKQTIAIRIYWAVNLNPHELSIAIEW